MDLNKIKMGKIFLFIEISELDKAPYLTGYRGLLPIPSQDIVHLHYLTVPVLQG